MISNGNRIPAKQDESVQVDRWHSWRDVCCGAPAVDSGGFVMEKSGWHVEKSVSVGHIITTVSMVVSIIWWASTVETRIAVNSQKIAAIEAAMKRQEDTYASMRQEIKADLGRLESKIDRLIERDMEKRR